MRTTTWLSCAALAAGCGFLPVDSKSDGALPVSLGPTGPERDGCAEPSRRSEVRVAVEGGELEGVRLGTATAYLGVPYAAPPLAGLRFQPPQRAACWTGVRAAARPGARCAQPGPSGELVGSEDCLYLNVFAPSAEAARPRPVLVFLHGGDGQRGGAHPGDGTLGQLDGSGLAAAQDAVVVTVAWRLGALGFTSHPLLRAQGEGAGNYGLLDTIAALRWVRRNARAFGGDEGRVLVFGEAAGAVNACALLAAPQALGLFSAVLLQSGACAAADASGRDEAGRALADSLGCSGADALACLRAAPADALARAQPASGPLLASWQTGFGPMVDGLLLEEAPLAALAAGRAAPVPLAVGSNADEFALFLQGDAMAACSEYAPYLEQVFGPLAPQVEQRYPCDEVQGPVQAAVAAVTDALYACPARRAARAASFGRALPVYRYLYAHARAYGPLSKLRAYHSAELPFLFSTLDAEGYQPTPQDERLTRAMQGYWASLARGELPSAHGELAWSRYQPSFDNALVLDDGVREGPGAQGSACDFWDAVSP